MKRPNRNSVIKAAVVVVGKVWGSCPFTHVYTQTVTSSAPLGPRSLSTVETYLSSLHWLGLRATSTYIRRLKSLELDHNYIMDLSCIETNLYLKRFSISISMDRDTDSEFLRPIIGVEARRLACAFVGADYCLDIEEKVCDWAPVESLAPRAGLFVSRTFVRNEKG